MSVWAFWEGIGKKPFPRAGSTLWQLAQKKASVAYLPALALAKQVCLAHCWPGCCHPCVTSELRCAGINPAGFQCQTETAEVTINHLSGPRSYLLCCGPHGPSSIPITQANPQLLLCYQFSSCRECWWILFFGFSTVGLFCWTTPWIPAVAPSF